jgi:hypothetical protein
MLEIVVAFGFAPVPSAVGAAGLLGLLAVGAVECPPQPLAAAIARRMGLQAQQFCRCSHAKVFLFNFLFGGECARAVYRYPELMRNF